MWNIREFDEVTSTSEIARQMLAANTASHGDVVQAQHQTAGRGRIVGRTWQDERGNSLLMSVVLKHAPAGGQSLQYCAALCVLDALRNVATARNADPAAFTLKWPNDILLNRK
jgi:BirA family biotin operon repressor/biotin-[acetyl-CoA-carboxylase] ligase